MFEKQEASNRLMKLHGLYVTFAYINDPWKLDIDREGVWGDGSQEEA